MRQTYVAQQSGGFLSVIVGAIIFGIARLTPAIDITVDYRYDTSEKKDALQAA